MNKKNKSGKKVNRNFIQRNKNAKSSRAALERWKSFPELKCVKSLKQPGQDKDLPEDEVKYILKDGERYKIFRTSQEEPGTGKKLFYLPEAQTGELFLNFDEVQEYFECSEVESRWNDCPFKDSLYKIKKADFKENKDNDEETKQEGDNK